MQSSPANAPESEPVIHPVHTACKNCIFAEYKKGDDRKLTQIGCRFGRKEKFEASGNLVEAFDNDSEFDVVNGRYCNTYRTAEWAKNVPEADQVATARHEVVLRVDIIVCMENSEDPALLEPLQKTIESLQASAIKPMQVVFLNNQDRVPVRALHSFLMKTAANLTWKLTDVIDRKKDGARISREDILDIAADKCSGHFYVVVTPGFCLPKTFILDLDKAVNDDLELFVVQIPPDGLNGLTVSLPMHKSGLINGNTVALVQFDEPQLDLPAIGEMSEDGKEIRLRNVSEKLQWLAFSHENSRMVKHECPNK